jgi:hypothetical protein
MLVFVDESGDPGIKGKLGSSALFVIVAVIFEDHEDADACDKKIQEVKMSCFRDEREEFHFTNCRDDRRERFLSAVAAHDFFYLAFVLNKSKLWGPGFAYKDSFYKYTSRLLFENAKPYLNEAKVIIDKSGNREFRKQLEKYLKGKINTDGQAIRKVTSEESHRNNLLQLADMVCGAVARSYKPGKKNSNAFRKIVAHRELNVQVWPKA